MKEVKTLFRVYYYVDEVLMWIKCVYSWWCFGAVGKGVKKVFPICFLPNGFEIIL